MKSGRIRISRLGSCLMLVALCASALSACGGSSDSDAELLQKISDLQAQIDAGTTTSPPATTRATTTTSPPATTRATTTTRAVIPVPDLIIGSTQEDDAGQTLEVYISLTDSNQEPITATPEATLTLGFLDPLGNELYQEEFILGQDDLWNWTKNFGGSKHSGFIIRVPMSDIDRSLTGSTGTVTIYLQYSRIYFDYEFETNDLPEASEAMKAAASLARYSETSVELSQVNLASRQWQLKPLKAGCYTEFGSYGRSEEGIRVDFEIENLDSSIETFYDDALLRTPDGFTIEPDYSSTLRGLEAIPGIREMGYLFFEDLDCLMGDYRIVMSNYYGVYLDEVFTLE